MVYFFGLVVVIFAGNCEANSFSGDQTEGLTIPTPRTVEEVSSDFRDMVNLYQTCHPGELCLPQIYVSVVTTCLLDSFCRKRLFQMINDLPTIFEVVRTMMSMVALVALAETTSVQMSFGFAATSVRNGSMEDV
ncbi:hypothetical protein YC2023_025010 [Brassica napus]